MRKVALYIEDQRVDLFDDETISLTQTIQNVRDIDKVFTPFSKSFTLPASKTNNKVFSHYYNPDILNGFDARKKVAATIEINQLPFQEGKIKLEGVDLKDNVPYAYRVTFFGNTVDLKDVLGEDSLGALNWLSNFKRSYNATQVRTDLQTDGVNITVGATTYTDAICVPLISCQTELFYDPSVTPPDYFNADGTINPLGANLYAVGGNDNGVYFEELKYAIRVWVIVKAIEEQYPEITFSAGSFIKDTSNAQFYDLYMWMHRQKGFAFKAAEVTNKYVSFPSDSVQMTRVFSTPLYLIVFNLFGSQTVTYNLNITSSPAADFSISIYRNGVLYQQGSFTGGVTGASMSGTMTNGNYDVYVTGATSNSVQLQWVISDTTLSESGTFSGTTQTLTSGNVWDSQAQIPNIKIIDFLTGLFKMFNLTAYKNSAGEIVVQTLDDFYASGTTRDISKYVDINESQVDVALPYKEIKFEYKGRGTKLAQQFEQEQDSGWGTEYYVVDNELLGDYYKVEAPFEHMQFLRASGTDVQFGSCVDDNGDAYIGEPLLFYRVLKISGTNIRFVESASSVTIINAYCMPSNSVSTSAATDDDTNHFSVEINEYTPTDTFDGSLYANYYESYIAEVFNAKRRLTKVKAYLPVSFLINYSLADTIFINNKYYRINSITTNLQTGESELELLNIV